MVSGHGTRGADVSLPPGARVCIVMLTGLGDVVNALPLVNALKAHDPSCHVTWVAEPMPARILRPHPAVDEVVVYHKDRGARGVLDLRSDLAGRRFDVTLNLNLYFKSIWPTLLSRAPRRLGFGRDRARDGVWLAATERLPRAPWRHNVDMFREFLPRLGVRGPAVPEWGLQFTEAEQRARTEFFARLGGGLPAVAVVPTSGSPKKDWLVPRWAEVLDVLAHDFGLRPILLGGPGAREVAAAREIAAASRADAVWALGDGVRRMAWILSGCSLLVAPDTGPVHIARALGVPIVGLYGHTNPWRVGPYRACEDLWVDRYTDPGEAPDPSRIDPKLGRMEQITVDDVLARVEWARTRYAPAHARDGGNTGAGEL